MILETIAKSTRMRVEKKKQILSLEEIKQLALNQEKKGDFPFEKALRKKGMSFICEVKKASPSKGIIARKFPYLDIAKEYEEAGADAILLICALLTKEELTEFLNIAKSLELSALVEAHDADEISMALQARARIIGVNNRNLKDFTVDLKNSINMRKLVSKEVLFVAESGIRTREDVKKLEKEEVDAVLIGETLMKSEKKETILKALRGEGI